MQTHGSDEGHQPRGLEDDAIRIADNVKELINRADGDGDGRLSKAEWEKEYDPNKLKFMQDRLTEVRTRRPQCTHAHPRSARSLPPLALSEHTLLY